MSISPRYVRLQNNLPRERDVSGLAKRILTSGWTWVLVAAILLYTLCLFGFFGQLLADVEVDGQLVESSMNPSALRQAAWLATPTLLVWVLIFLIADRFRPQRPLVWFLALGWGASVAVLISSTVNTWAAFHVQIFGLGNPAAAARPAVFIAPFVEEGAKATVLFWLAILVRYRLVSIPTMISLAGLTAIGFAFTENILYYSQAIVYGSQTIEVGDVSAAVGQMVLTRGVLTSFGHPLFTSLTGIGLAIGLRTRSKVVRILAPLSGFLLAAGGHMLFNSVASSSSGAIPWSLLLIGLPLVLAVTIFAIRQTLVQGRLIRNRLEDYVRAGWLPASDPIVFSRLRTRLRASFLALSRGWQVFAATNQLQRAATELAYLRDAQTRGIVDVGGNMRAVELLQKVERLRATAIVDPRGLRISWPRLPRLNWGKAKASPASLATTSANPGFAGYSAVDPKWGPPGG